MENVHIKSEQACGRPRGGGPIPRPAQGPPSFGRHKVGTSLEHCSNIPNIARTFRTHHVDACSALQLPQIDPTLGHFDHIEHRTDPTLARDHVEHCSNISNIARTMTLLEHFEHCSNIPNMSCTGRLKGREAKKGAKGRG